MSTVDENESIHPRKPRKKGGGDGKAKDASESKKKPHPQAATRKASRPEAPRTKSISGKE
jgi:hypothetical protein